MYYVHELNRSGFKATCSECNWYSPIYPIRLNAEAVGKEHVAQWHPAGHALQGQVLVSPMKMLREQEAAHDAEMARLDGKVVEIRRKFCKEGIAKETKPFSRHTFGDY